jgi:hypothetical protein
MFIGRRSLIVRDSIKEPSSRQALNVPQAKQRFTVLLCVVLQLDWQEAIHIDSTVTE